MTKKILKILSQSKKNLCSQDLTPVQKQRLFELMVSYGTTQGFAYDRIFKEGFDDWELIGIDNIKRDFLKEHDAELGDYERILALAADEKGKFYSILEQTKGLKTKLKDKMFGMGMSLVTCQTRFAVDNWKPWERVGFLHILNQFIEAEGDNLE